MGSIGSRSSEPNVAIARLPPALSSSSMSSSTRVARLAARASRKTSVRALDSAESVTEAPPLLAIARSTSCASETKKTPSASPVLATSEAAHAANDEVPAPVPSPMRRAERVVPDSGGGTARRRAASRAAA
eukprot:scaffold20352_cov28-Tisochrysis_lutea.AAC.3